MLGLAKLTYLEFDGRLVEMIDGISDQKLDNLLQTCQSKSFKHFCRSIEVKTQTESIIRKSSVKTKIFYGNGSYEEMDDKEASEYSYHLRT